MHPSLRHIYYYSQGGGETPDFFISSDGDGVGTEADPLGPSALSSLEANKVYALKRGDTFEIGEIDIDVSGVTITAYGEGDDPILTGSEDISGLVWTDEGSGVYSTPMVTEPNWIWIDGECAKNAETARIPIISRGSTTTITVSHANVSGYSSIVGSYCVVKETQFRNSQKVLVTAYNGAGVITIGQISGQIESGIPVANNIDLVLYNSTEYLSGNNEWAWRDGTLYVKAAASPSTLNIRAGDFDYAFKTTSNTTFQNLEIQEYYRFGITSEGGNFTIQDCHLHDIRDTSIMSRNQTGVLLTHTVKNNLIERIGNVGIDLGSLENSLVEGNTLDEIGMQENYGWMTYEHASGGTHAGSMAIDCFPYGGVNGAGNIFRRNIITNIAYSGITMQCGFGYTIQYNVVSDHMQRFDDGGGIYTFSNNSSVPNEDNEISYNIVYDARSTSTTAFGIYVDNGSKSANVHHNTIYRCYWGVLFNYDATDHTCEDNLISDCTRGVVYRRTSDETTSNQNINNQFNRNIIACSSSSQRCVEFEITAGSFPTWNPFSGTGGADNNIYINPYDVNIADSDNKGADLTLSELQVAYGEDANSTSLTNYITSPGNPSTDIVLITNKTNAVAEGTAGYGYETVEGVYTTDYSIPAYSGLLLIRYPSSENSIFFESASSQYVNLGTTDDVQFAHDDAFSIHFDFKIPANPSGNQIIMSNLGTTNRGYQVFVNASGQIGVELRNTATTNTYIIRSNSDFADNAWHCFLYIKPSAHSNSKIYIDNVAVATTATSNSLTDTIASTEDLIIGGRESVSQYLDGYIDEVAIWNSNQDANRNTIYNTGITHDLSNLAVPPLHYWKLGDDGYVDSGTSASKLNGTAVNNPTVSTDVP